MCDTEFGTLSSCCYITIPAAGNQSIACRKYFSLLCRKRSTFCRQKVYCNCDQPHLLWKSFDEIMDRGHAAPINLSASMLHQCFSENVLMFMLLLMCLLQPLLDLSCAIKCSLQPLVDLSDAIKCLLQLLLDVSWDFPHQSPKTTWLNSSWHYQIASAHHDLIPTQLLQANIDLLAPCLTVKTMEFNLLN